MIPKQVDLNKDRSVPMNHFHDTHARVAWIVASAFIDAFTGDYGLLWDEIVDHARMAIVPGSDETKSTSAVMVSVRKMFKDQGFKVITTADRQYKLVKA